MATDTVMRSLRGFAGAALIAFSALGTMGTLSQAAEPLMLEARIPLGEIPGRIDRLAYDSKRGRLIVAELGNNSVSILDLDQRRGSRRRRGSLTSQPPTRSMSRARATAPCGATRPKTSLRLTAPISAMTPTTSASTHGATESSSAMARGPLR